MTKTRLICGIGCLGATLAWGANTCTVKPTISTHVQVISATNGLPDLEGTLGTEVNDALQQALQAFVADPFGAQPATSATATRAAGPQAWLGVGTDALSEDARSLLPEGVAGGLIVRHVDADSPAAKAGVQVNDILLKVDDQLLVNPEQLRQLVQMRKDGDQLALTALRKGKEVKLEAGLVMKESADEDAAGVQVIRLGDMGNIKMELPAEIQKMLESAGGGATVFSTSIVVRTGSGGGFSTSSGGKGNHSSGGSSAAGISAKTENGNTTITYKGEEVFSGPTSGRVSTKAVNINGDESAAAFDGDKVLWESKPGAADALRK